MWAKAHGSIDTLQLNVTSRPANAMDSVSQQPPNMAAEDAVSQHVPDHRLWIVFPCLGFVFWSVHLLSFLFSVCADTLCVKPFVCLFACLDLYCPVVHFVSAWPLIHLFVIVWMHCSADHAFGLGLLVLNKLYLHLCSVSCLLHNTQHPICVNNKGGAHFSVVHLVRYRYYFKIHPLRIEHFQIRKFFIATWSRRTEMKQLEDCFLPHSKKVH